MGNCFSEVNVCNGNFDINLYKKHHTESIDVYLDKTEYEAPLISLVKAGNIEMHDPNKLIRYIEIYEKNIEINISKIQKFYRKFKMHKEIFWKANKTKINLVENKKKSK